MFYAKNFQILSRQICNSSSYKSLTTFWLLSTNVHAWQKCFVKVLIGRKSSQSLVPAMIFLRFFAIIDLCKVYSHSLKSPYPNSRAFKNSEIRKLIYFFLFLNWFILQNCEICQFCVAKFHLNHHDNAAEWKEGMNHRQFWIWNVQTKF